MDWKSPGRVKYRAAYTAKKLQNSENILSNNLSGVGIPDHHLSTIVCEERQHFWFNTKYNSKMELLLKYWILRRKRRKENIFKKMQSWQDWIVEPHPWSSSCRGSWSVDWTYSTRSQVECFNITFGYKTLFLKPNNFLTLKTFVLNDSWLWLNAFSCTTCPKFRRPHQVKALVHCSNHCCYCYCNVDDQAHLNCPFMICENWFFCSKNIFFFYFAQWLLDKV